MTWKRVFRHWSKRRSGEPAHDRGHAETGTTVGRAESGSDPATVDGHLLPEGGIVVRSDSSARAGTRRVQAGDTPAMGGLHVLVLHVEPGIKSVLFVNGSEYDRKKRRDKPVRCCECKSRTVKT